MKFRLFIFVIPFLLGSCWREVNLTTDWDSNLTNNGGFQKVPYHLQETAPGMILVEGGEYHIPNFGISDTLEIPSFYLSKCEESNGQYLEYLNFLKKYYSDFTFKNALPDSTVWNQLDTTPEVKKYFVNNYLRDWRFKDYPVVGLNRNQITRYAIWKTDRINEMILIREGILEEDRPINDSMDIFSTTAYLDDTYTSEAMQQNLEVTTLSRNVRIRMEDGILLPEFRLPTQREWQQAHLAIGDSNDRYYKTAKPGRIKLSNFHFLDDIESTSKKTDSPQITLEGLQKVYSLPHNAYFLKGLNSNVAECIGDSSSTGMIGGSFLVHQLDNGAVYNKDIAIGIRYYFKQPLQEMIQIKADETGIYGFRLAMNCEMKWVNVRSTYKRRRYSRYRPK